MKSYKCCMIYQNYQGNPVVEGLRQIRKKRDCKNIYPSTKEDIGGIKSEIINRSKKYAVLLGRESDQIAGSFKINIEEAAQNTADYKEKKILYSILDGSKKSSNVQKVEKIFQDYGIPRKQIQFLDSYSPQKLENYIKESSRRGVAKETISLICFVVAVVLLIAVAVLMYFNQEDVHLLLGWTVGIWNKLKGAVIECLAILGVQHNEVSESVIDSISILITVVPIPVIWLACRWREHTSPHPLLWLKIRRILILLNLLTISIICEGVYFLTFEESSIVGIPEFEFERLAVKDIEGCSDNIYIQVNDIFAPDGDIWIEQNGNKIYSSVDSQAAVEGQSNNFQRHMSKCPELEDQVTYVMGWNLDIIKQEEVEFSYHIGQPIKIHIESIPKLTNFCDITKETLLTIAEEIGIDSKDSFKLYSQNDEEPVMINMNAAKEKDTLFCMDIGLTCLVIKEEDQERNIMFTTNGGTNNCTVLDNQEIPDGSIPIYLEFLE